MGDTQESEWFYQFSKEMRSCYKGMGETQTRLEESPSKREEPVYQMIEYANLIEMEWCHCRIMDQTGTGENLIRKSYIEMMATEREKLSAQIKKQIENVLKTKQ